MMNSFFEKIFIYKNYIIICLAGLMVGIDFFLGYYLWQTREMVKTMNNDKVDMVTSPEIMNSVKDEPTTTKIKVDIKGSVKKPGVYEVDEGTIVNDVLKMAGGVTSNGTTAKINLSMKLKNEMVIYVDSKIRYINVPAVQNDVAIEKSEVVGNKTENVTETNKVININLATKEELMTLNSIGEAKALSIIEYRITNGNFKTVDEIKNVKGLGESIFAKIKDNITV